jgi:hypothetical protein
MPIDPRSLSPQRCCSVIGKVSRRLRPKRSDAIGIERHVALDDSDRGVRGLIGPHGINRPLTP